MSGSIAAKADAGSVPTDGVESFDVVVVGAGAGGTAAAALCQHRGHRTLLVESKSAVGGRASTTWIDGFGINTGAQIFEMGGDNRRLFDELGVPMRVRAGRRPLALRLGSTDVPIMSGPVGLLLNRVVIPLLGAFSRRTGRLRPPPGITLEQWLDRAGASAAVLRLIRNLTSAMFAAEPSDVEAVVFFDYMTRPGGLAVYGAHTDGSIGPWADVADHFRACGGTLWLDSEVEGIGLDGHGRADTVTVRRGAEEVMVRVGSVVSNVGPVGTIGLLSASALPAEYVNHVRQADRPGTLITINFATRARIKNLRNLVFFGHTERLAYANGVSELSPGLAPAGWHLYAASSTPHPAVSGFDIDAEVATLAAEAEREFPEYADAKIISVDVCTGDWPGQRAIPGNDWPPTTPVPNVWNVGDGARPWLGAGQSGCVASAYQAVELLEAERARSSAA